MSNGLFKKFSTENISPFAATKASDQKKIRRDLVEQFGPVMEPYWDEILPRKSDLMVITCTEGVELIAVEYDPSIPNSQSAALAALDEEQREYASIAGAVPPVMPLFPMSLKQAAAASGLAATAAAAAGSSSSPGLQVVLFFQHRGGPFMPTLRLLHRYPMMLPQHQVDIGGCKFVVSGAQVMTPGLLKVPGGRVAPNVSEGDVVAVYIEGKQHAVSVGLALKSSEQIVEDRTGPCVENIHHMGDGLWWLPVIAPESVVGKSHKKVDKDK
jgi:PUA domain protein